MRCDKTMASYMEFAKVYDMFMDNVPYDEWTKYLSELLNVYGVNEGLVLDLGCGTGNVTTRLCDRGYDMIGVDYSEEMLEIANEKRIQSGQNILYLNQDTGNEGLSALCGLAALIPYYIILYLCRDRIRRQLTFYLE